MPLEIPHLISGDRIDFYSVGELRGTKPERITHKDYTHAGIYAKTGRNVDRGILMINAIDMQLLTLAKSKVQT